MSTQPSTPPHLPTYNVHLTDDQIRGIVQTIFPAGKLGDVQQIERGKSYNNRVYYLTVNETGPQDASTSPLSLVLKVSGHYFGPNKVENEVGSLLLLRNACPSIPTPDVVAWSETGSQVDIAKHWSRGPSKTQEPEMSIRLPHDLVSDHGWVLLTRLPGRSLTVDDLNGVDGGALLKEVATLLTTFREKVAPNPYFGNLRYATASDSTNIIKDIGLGERPFAVGGLLQSTSYCADPLTSKVAFYQFKANDKLKELQTRAALKDLRPQVERHLEELISKLPSADFMYDGDKPAVFTHYDFSPRNILINDSDGQKHISGLLDFEFAMFCPVEEEFINPSVRQPNDWPEPHWQALLDEMEKAGCAIWRQQQDGEYRCGRTLTQACDCREHQYQKLCTLAEVLEHVAPWWIKEGSMTDEQLEKEAKRCVEVVLRGIKALAL